MTIGVDEQGSASHLAALDAMERYGGSFVRNLAIAWKRADEENHARLVGPFRHYLDQYFAMAAYMCLGPERTQRENSHGGVNMSETDNHEVGDLNQRLAAVKPPFVASEYVGLPGDRILFVAHDPNTGICCAGRESSDEAQYDAQGMRAAWWLGYATAMEVIKALAAYEVDRSPRVLDAGGQDHEGGL